MKAPKHQPSEYLATELWHRQSGSMQYYIDHMQSMASADDAPIDALYKTHETDKEPNTWRTMKDLSEGHPFREDYAKYLAARTGTNKQ